MMNTKLDRNSESQAQPAKILNSSELNGDTIIAHNSSTKTHEIFNIQTAAMQNSTNATNNSNKGSLTNSQIAIIPNNEKDTHIYTTPELMAVNKNDKSTVTEVFDIFNKVSALKSSEQKPFKSVIEKPKEFSIIVFLGIFQLILSVTLAALGGLQLARNASLASAGSGLWTGGISGIAGSLGVINIRRAQTGFLVVSLICIASSTLAMALTGIGLVRDTNSLSKESSQQTAKSAISAGCGLIVVLLIHFVISIISVYKTAQRLCSREEKNVKILENAISTSLISQQKVEEYIKSMEYEHQQQQVKQQSYPQLPSKREKEKSNKMMTIWLQSMKRVVPIPKPCFSPPLRTIMLVPATLENGITPFSVPPNGYSHPMMLHPSFYPPGVVIPQIKRLSYNINSSSTAPRMHSACTTIEINKRHDVRTRHSSKINIKKRQRRKSDSELENKLAFTYTGLDRAIANSFLERQEQSIVNQQEAIKTDTKKRPDVIV